MVTAADKLRMVLDYVPCEACLAQPTEDPRDQELLCSVCARVHREVAARIAVRTTVLVERPELPPAVVIPPAAPEPETLPVVLEPYAEPTPVPMLSQEEPPEPEPEEPLFDDVAEYTPPVDDVFEYVKRDAPRAPEPQPEPAAAPADDFVFMPPQRVPEPERAPEPVEVAPSEEVPVEPEAPQQSPWAPPEEIFPEEPQPQALMQEISVVEEEATYAPPAEPAVVPAEIVEDEETAPNPVAAPPDEDEIVETTLVEPEDEVVETTLVDDAPAPPPGALERSDLWRLRGFSEDAEKRLLLQRIESLSHLSGHDASDLAERTGLPADTVAGWVNVADLVQEAGIPVEAATALVAAGIAGPRGLRETSAEDILERVGAFGGGYVVHASDLKRWKRRV